MVFGERKNLIKIARDRISKESYKYLDHIYGEHEMGGTSWLYLSGTSFNDMGLRTDLGNSPAIDCTVSALGAVPIIIGLWPVFLAGIYAVTRRRDIIASKEKNLSVQMAVEKVQMESDSRLASAIEKAEIDKKVAVDNAVKEFREKEEEGGKESAGK